MSEKIDKYFLLCVCFLLTFLVRGQTSALHKEWEIKSRQMQDDLQMTEHVTTAGVLELVTSAVRPLTADFFWVRATTLKADELFAMQREAAAEGMPRLIAYGSLSRTKKDNFELYELLRQVTYFDPSFEYAYFYGGHLLAFDGETDLAISLLEDGVRKNPGSGMIPSTLAFVYYYFQKDWETGAQYAQMSFRNSGKYSSMYKEVVNLYGAAQEYKMAIQFLKNVLDTTKDPATRSQLEEQLRYLTVEDEIAFLQKAVDKYREANNGRPPPYIERLAETNVINKVPREPFGGKFVIGPNGQVNNDPPNRFEHYKNIRNFIPDRGMRVP